MSRPAFARTAGAILGLVLACNAIAGEFGFREAHAVSPPGMGSGVTAADIDGNGLDDLAYISSERLDLYLQVAGEGLGAPVTIDLNPRYGKDVEIVDLGGDGTIEILVGHLTGLSVYGWRSGQATWIADHPMPFPCGQVTHGDVDLDEKPDILCLDVFGRLRLFNGASGSGFASSRDMLTPAYGELTVKQPLLRDVTGDGRVDLLLAESSANAFYVYPHDGESWFEPAIAYPYPESNDAWGGVIEVADVDGDAVPEVIVTKPCNVPCAAILIYRRGQDGLLRLAERRASLDIPLALATTDLDGNGRMDLVVGHAGWRTVGAFMGVPGGLARVASHGDIRTSARSSRYAVGDFNGDGLGDVATVSLSGLQVVHGAWRPANDLDGDLLSDVLWQHSGGAKAAWLSADWQQALPLPNLGADWSMPAVGDWGGDAEADIFYRNATTGANAAWRIWRGIAATTGVRSQDWQVVGAGDFDGDQLADLLWRNASTGANVSWLGGSASAQKSVSRVADLAWRVVGVGDFDGDTYDDILWRHASLGHLRVWPRADSAGERALASVTDLDWQVAGLGDFDADGRDDIVWRNRRSGANAIWRSADATSRHPVRNVGNTTWHIAAVGDYDGDNRADLLWRHLDAGSAVIWLRADAGRTRVVARVSTTWKIVH